MPSVVSVAVLGPCFFPFFLPAANGDGHCAGPAWWGPWWHAYLGMIRLRSQRTELAQFRHVSRPRRPIRAEVQAWLARSLPVGSDTGERTRFRDTGESGDHALQSPIGVDESRHP